MKKQDFEYFSVTHYTERVADAGNTQYKATFTDRYHRPRYSVERAVVRTGVELLDRYLRQRPHKRFDSRINLARTFVYMAPAMRALYEYMPGGFYTLHAYDPARKRTKKGKWIDPLGRAMLRHANDPSGVRSRAYAMAWRVQQRYGDATRVTWMSIACGVGQATYDAARLLAADVNFYMTDVDEDALAATREMAHSYNIEDDLVTTEKIHVITQMPQLLKRVAQNAPTVVDAMGLFEYLSDDDATTLLRSLYGALKPGASLYFTNMLPTHPHLTIHRHGLGWPGVIVRSQDEVLALCQAADIPLPRVGVVLPSDGVYAVYEVTK